MGNGIRTNKQLAGYRIEKVILNPKSNSQSAESLVGKPVGLFFGLKLLRLIS
jgi:hypothetical protein